MTVLVTGARGNIGSRLVAELARRRHPVRASARDLTGLVLPDGVEPVRLDLLEPHNAEAALAGVDAIFLYPTRTAPTEFLAAAEKAGVRYVVLLSSPDVFEGAPDNPIRRGHLAAERAVRESGLRHTVIYPGWLASDARRDWGEQIRTGDRVGIAHPEGQFTPIHEDDIAEVVAELLTTDRYHGHSLTLTGPESLSQAEIVAVLAEELGRPIAVEALTRQQAHDRREPWMPEAILDHLITVAERAGAMPAPVNNTVERFTGHPPRTFRQWAAEHKEHFSAKG
ncbi:SDR family oxidoreductase [Amycolatopsis sp. 195334CR]|uniref:SDR family oxidoreductase n=1 Tax=Amycolatopsis sp. 195334CR TaxID=2814588 RepID=UPI001A9070CF|nr:NAD(P)H-binding protein [Amycolatopsis sp. 195334CR]MBN6037296.1 NAD(P)H-binding protein [Amycolatopsis sp. 195334CR]